MRHNRIRHALLASAFTAAALASAPASAESNAYDGLWNVTVVTKSGSCEPTTSSTLVVTDGKVSAGGAAVSGKVGQLDADRSSDNNHLDERLRISMARQ